MDGDGALVGIVTDGDIRRHVEDGIETRKAAEVMTAQAQGRRCRSAGGRGARPDDRKKITQLFVLEEGSRKPVGVLHIHDCLRAGWHDGVAE